MAGVEVEAPYGFWVDGEGRTRRPRAVQRVRKSEVGGLKLVDLVAVERVEKGEVVLVEKPLLTWGEVEMRVGEGEGEKVLLQRILAIKKMAGAMQKIGGYCDSTLPYLQQMCLARYRRQDVETIWGMPWELRDTTLIEEELKFLGSFCVMAQRGLSKTCHEKTFKDINEILKLCVIVEKGKIPIPGGDGLFKYTSMAGRIAASKPKLNTVGARPGSRRPTASKEVPTPNADYTITDDGKLTLTAKRDISFGERITVPLGKLFVEEKSAGGGNPLDVFRDAKKLKDAALHKAAMSDAPDNIKKLAEAEHPKIPPQLPPPGSAASLPPRDVSCEIWKEPISTSIFLIDHLYTTSECAAIIGCLSRSGTPTQMPYHIGFESHARIITATNYSSTIKSLMQRCAAHLPKTLGPYALKGVGNQGMFLRLTPGEELLELTMQTTLKNGKYMPFALMLSGEGGQMELQGSEHKLSFKPGRLVYWNEGVSHKVPVNTSGTNAVMFSYLIYG